MWRRIMMRNDMLYRMNHKQKNILLLLDGFLLIGFLSYAILFFTLNKILNPANLLEELIEQRIFWRDLSEKILALCGVIYLVGHICALYYARKKKVHFSLKSLTLYFFLQIGIMIACVVPFGLLDRTYFFDYLFPLWNILMITVFLFFVSLFMLVNRK